MTIQRSFEMQIRSPKVDPAPKKSTEIGLGLRKLGKEACADGSTSAVLLLQATGLWSAKAGNSIL
jgi:hypothetical protein